MKSEESRVPRVSKYQLLMVQLFLIASTTANATSSNAPGEGQCHAESILSNESHQSLTLDQILAIERPNFSAERVAEGAVLIRRGDSYQLATTNPVGASPLYPVAFGPKDTRWIPHYRLVNFKRDFSDAAVSADRGTVFEEMLTESELKAIDDQYRPRLERIPAVIQIVTPSGVAFLSAYFHGNNLVEPKMLKDVSFTPLLKVLGAKTTDPKVPVATSAAVPRSSSELRPVRFDDFKNTFSANVPAKSRFVHQLGLTKDAQLVVRNALPPSLNPQIKHVRHFRDEVDVYQRSDVAEQRKLHLLSPFELRMARDLSEKQGQPVIVEAIVPNGYSYVAAFLNGRVVTTESNLTDAIKASFSQPERWADLTIEPRKPDSHAPPTKYSSAVSFERFYADSLFNADLVSDSIYGIGVGGSPQLVVNAPLPAKVGLDRVHIRHVRPESQIDTYEKTSTAERQNFHQLSLFELRKAQELSLERSELVIVEAITPNGYSYVAAFRRGEPLTMDKDLIDLIELSVNPARTRRPMFSNPWDRIRGAKNSR